MARRLWTSLALWLPGNPEVQDNKHLTDPSHGTWGKKLCIPESQLPGQLSDKRRPC